MIIDVLFSWRRQDTKQLCIVSLINLSYHQILLNRLASSKWIDCFKHSQGLSWEVV